MVVGATAAVLAPAAFWIPFSAATARHPAFARHDWTRLHFAPGVPRPLPLASPVEYTPRAAAAAGWFADAPTSDAILLDRLTEARAAALGLAVTPGPAGALAVRGEASRPAALVLP